MNIEWIRERFTCSDERLANSRRSHTAAPKVVQLNDEAWLMGTDGHVAVAIRHDGDGEPIEPGLADRISIIFGTPGQAVRLPVSDLRAWAGEPMWLSTVTCTECHGSGEGYGECECRCGNIHQAACYECNGTGHTVEGLEVRPAMLLGVALNKLLLARLLEGVTDEEVDAFPNIERGTLTFVPPDGSWRGAVMGLLDRDGRANRDTFSWTQGVPA